MVYFPGKIFFYCFNIIATIKHLIWTLISFFLCSRAHLVFEGKQYVSPQFISDLLDDFISYFWNIASFVQVNRCPVSLSPFRIHFYFFLFLLFSRIHFFFFTLKYQLCIPFSTHSACLSRRKILKNKKEHACFVWLPNISSIIRRIHITYFLEEKCITREQMVQ